MALRILLAVVLAQIWPLTFADVNITVQDVKTKEIPATMYGYMWEDINHSGDGGLYAELLQNRAFQKTTNLTGWDPLTESIELSVVTGDGVSAALPNSLEVAIESGTRGFVSFANTGYWGIKVTPNTTYSGSLYARLGEGTKYRGDLCVSLQSATDEPVVFAETVAVHAGVLTRSWAKFTFTLKTGDKGTDNINNVFAIRVNAGAMKGPVNAAATLNFGLFSLFPPTYNDRPNGLRKDLAEVMAATAPKVWRFPGGNNLEGETIDTRWKWNETIGPLEDRPGRLGDWSYINTDGLGLMEYLQWAEDLDATVILGVYAGYSLNGASVPQDELQPYIQEVLDELHFLLDPSTTKLGAWRASLGHEDPYDIRYVEVGNEDNLSGPVPTYQSYRWKMYHDAIRAEFPAINIMATTRASQPVDPVPEFIDYHVYTHPRGLVNLATQYDNVTRATKYFVGEYAIVSLNTSDIWNNRMPWPVVRGAASEASYMIGFERNADVVFASAYAPTLQHVNGTQWTPNLIAFDAGKIVRSVSYFVQWMFGTHVGTHVLESGSGLANPVFWTVSVHEEARAVYLKLANVAETVQTASVDVSALPVDFTADAEWITIGDANLNASNAFDSGEVYTPKTTWLSLENGLLELPLGPWSASVVTLTLV
ncbi:glycoside hydrolase [Auriculariales sp. MPI-PUGE-AT-0066]|nr:glycoside hydrolase [Auriculariales sp. MPI-PUGE-AT-0066]